jgi:photosystem II stability/assembly factor-like uncharacterized protein
MMSHKRLWKYMPFFLIMFFSVSLLGAFTKNSNQGAQNDTTWTQTPIAWTFTGTGFAQSGGNLIAGAFSDWGVGNSVAFLLLSTDDGASWSFVDTLPVNNHNPNNGLYLSPYVTFAAFGGHLFAGIGQTYTGAVYRSDDNGITWNQLETSFVQQVYCLASSGGTLFAGTNNGVYVSQDTGLSWNPSNSSAVFAAYDSIHRHEPNILCLTVRDQDIFAGTSGQGIFQSTDNGASWIQSDSGLTNTYVTGLTSIGPRLFAATLRTPGDSIGGVYVSTDSGASWNVADTGLTNQMLNNIIAYGTTLIVGTQTGVFASTNNAASWQDISPGTLVDSVYIPALGVADSFLIAGTLEDGIWRYPLSHLPTGVNFQLHEAPSNFTLWQNYPNPFNPTTVITYLIPTKGLVTLDVFDLLGRMVKTLVNERQNAGEHSANFNAENLPSGVYFYRLSVPGFSTTKKLLLVK